MKSLKITIIAIFSTLLLSACGKQEKQPAAESNATATAETKTTTSLKDVKFDDVKKAAQTVAEETAKQAVKEAVKEIPYAAEVQKAMKAVSDLPASVKDSSFFSSPKFAMAKAENTLKSLKEIPIADTPEDFQTAYNEVVESYDKIYELVKKIPVEQSITGDSIKSMVTSFSASNMTELKNEFENSFNSLNDSRKKLMEIAKKYIK